MLKNLKSVLCSILPVVVFVSVIHLFVYRFETETFVNFLIGSGVLIVGQVLFLNGIDNSVVTMGEFVGNSITSMKTFWMYIIFAIVFGTFSTIAEPDLMVFANRVVVLGFPIRKTIFLFLAGAGVGLLMAFSLVRIVKKIPLQYVFLFFIAIIFVLALFIDESTFSMILDSGSSVAGVITSPFLLALGLGVSRIVTGKQSEDGSFGMITLCSFGAMIALLLYFVFVDPSKSFVVAEEGSMSLFLETLINVALSLFPLVLIFFIFEAFVIKISKQDKLKLLIGVGITFVGFYLFMFGIEFGMVAMGDEFGHFLSNLNNVPLACLICAFLGFFVVFCEPALRVLANQIEDVTHGNLRAKLVLPVVAISVVLALVLIIVKFVLDISIWWFVGGLVFWLLRILLGMWIMGWAASCGNEKDPPKENKNPYSKKQS